MSFDNKESLRVNICSNGCIGPSLKVVAINQFEVCFYLWNKDISIWNMNMKPKLNNSHISPWLFLLTKDSIAFCCSDASARCSSGMLLPPAASATPHTSTTSHRYDQWQLRYELQFFFKNQGFYFFFWESLTVDHDSNINY